MSWFILKIAALVLSGMYIGLAIGGKNPNVADKVLSVHEHSIAWVYKWIPAVYNLIKDVFKE